MTSRRFDSAGGGYIPGIERKPMGEARRQHVYGRLEPMAPAGDRYPIGWRVLIIAGLVAVTWGIVILLARVVL